MMFEQIVFVRSAGISVHHSYADASDAFSQCGGDMVSVYGDNSVWKCFVKDCLIGAVHVRAAELDFLSFFQRKLTEILPEKFKSSLRKDIYNFLTFQIEKNTDIIGVFTGECMDFIYQEHSGQSAGRRKADSPVKDILNCSRGKPESGCHTGESHGRIFQFLNDRIHHMP